ncbi:MAG TPA: hypothetical protein VH394_09225 [Thermoanaerobaculia bacterium]|jgi:hypothetical protein|nr:hypothetical protein [Thermoanaerobaculia bacterium]
MNAQRFSLRVCPAILILALFSASAHSADAPDTHNMLVVGEKTVYLSHLPMFQEEGQPPMPHRYQVILEVTFPQQKIYARDRQKHPTTSIYTLNPEDFVLPELVSSDAQHNPLGSIRAKQIFRGHLEREDSVPILEDVNVAVKRVIHFRQFDPKAQTPTQLEYILFGKGKELFLAHRITGPPDFDQMLSVKVTGHKFTDDELAQGVPVVFPGTKPVIADRLKAKQRIAGEVKVGSPLALQTIQVEVGKELYFEEGELRVPHTFATTPEEQRAGFP